MLLDNAMLESFKADREERKFKTRKAFDQFLYKVYSIVDIKHKDLEFIEIGKAYELPTVSDGEISSIRGENDRDGNLLYKVMFSKSSTLRKHRHSDMSEEIRVLSDNAFNIITGSEREGNLQETVLTLGEVLVIPKGLQHQVTNMNRREGSLEVRFIK